MEVESADWGFLVDNFSKKLQSWKGKMISIGGRVTLINSVLSAVPLYILSLFRVPKNILKQIDRHRCQFLWQGSGPKKAYALVNWKTICMAKEIGGAGILDLDQMNIAMLLKWWWKLKDHSYSSLWKSVVIYKYYSDNRALQFSSFWKDISKLEGLGNISVTYSPGQESQVLFWLDIWHQNCNLAATYPHLYSICGNKNVS